MYYHQPQYILLNNDLKTNQSEQQHLRTIKNTVIKQFTCQLLTEYLSSFVRKHPSSYLNNLLIKNGTCVYLRPA